MTDAATVPQEPKGIGGWLILPMLGTIISPLLTMAGLAESIDAFVKYGDKQTATWKYFVIGEIIFMLAIIAGWIVAAFKLFQHKRIYPSLFVFMLASTLVYNLADTVVVAAMFNQPFDPTAVRDIARPLISLIIWGPYMYLSKRVKNTFVN